jgi:GTP cyclohydrolase IA
MTTHPLFTRMVETAPAFVLQEQINEPIETPIHSAVRDILMEIGEDPDRQGLVSTPDRVSRMYQEVTSGYHTDPIKLVNGAIFDVDYSEPVVVKDIEFYSLCEHHMLPFFGRVHVAYIPDGKVIGLSKIPRIVEMYARRLQIQERMTTEIANFINDLLQPKGVAVVADGAHMCSMMRGVKKSQASMTTSTYLGAYRDDRQLRAEFLTQIARGRSES